ncbi:MAG: hypothetical protein HKM89_13955 [Gemmatimonadales bacterium]|nr:hypothetical protein [Gemmatimonadales bacterium]
MSQRWIFAPLALLIGCGQSSMQVPPSPSPESAVETFLESVADSNLAKMAQFWGTAKGSAAETNEPSDYQKRIEVMQVYLRHNSFQIASSRPSPDDENIRDVTVDIQRDTCVRQVPIQVVRTRDSRWIIRNIDLTALGNPLAPCRE